MSDIPPTVIVSIFLPPLVVFVGAFAAWLRARQIRESTAPRMVERERAKALNVADDATFDAWLAEKSNRTLDEFAAAELVTETKARVAALNPPAAGVPWLASAGRPRELDIATQNAAMANQYTNAYGIYEVEHLKRAIVEAERKVQPPRDSTDRIAM